MAKSNFKKFVADRLAEQEKAIIAEATEEYLGALPSYNITLNQFIADMKKDGLYETVGEMTLIELAKAMNPASISGKSRSGRMTKAQKLAILEKIPEFLAKNPWSKKKNLALGIGADPKKLNGPLRELLDAKKIKKSGVKGGTVYSLRGEKTKAP